MRDFTLDRIRFFAVLGVVCTHSAQKVSFSNSVFNQLFNFFEMGVIAFFVISLNLMSKIISKHDFKYQHFMYNRAIRLFPLYITFIIIYLPLNYLKALYDVGNPGFLYNLPLVLSNIFLLNSFFENSSYVVPGGWSISIELIFYTLAPIVVYISKNKNVHIKILILLTLYFGLISVYVYKNDTVFLNGFGPLYTHPLFQIPMFIFGGLLLNQKVKPTVGRLFLFLGLLASFIIHSNIIETQIDSIFYVFFFIIGIQFYINSNNTQKTTLTSVDKFITLVASLSYEIYLVHFIILNIISRPLKYLGFNLEGIVGLIIILSATLFGSIIISQRVIRPYSNLIVGFIKKVKAKSW
jgi:peptidoglycan/LPS O-acetylase OafA/YrhL